MRKRGILVLGGGISSEREVSLKTSFHLFQVAKKLFKEVSFYNLKSTKKFLKDIEILKPEIIINGLHGSFGEDGTLQAILNALEIKYTGSGVLASSLCMDKYRSSLIVEDIGVKIPQTMFNGDVVQFPCIVKPNSNGSSLGVTKVLGKENLAKAIKHAKEFSKDFIIQEFIDGKEITVAICASKVLEPVEIRPKKGFYNFKAKYSQGLTNFLIPSSLSKKDVKKVKELALKIYHTLGIRQYCRIDFIFKDGTFYFLEVNTLPGFTPTSLVPRVMSFEGMSIEEFVKYLVETAQYD